jgi:PTH1 family peptidyl-tRNA hydrolase
MKLIIGLGNPGAEYHNTRHNLGWQVLDFLLDKWIPGRARNDKGSARNNKTAWQNKKKFRAEIAELTLDGEKVLLARPQTFYNLSGESTRAIRDFYGLTNADILVIHDEMALPVGTIRTRRDGQDAGNNGVRNLIEQLGADFARIRIGSGQVAPPDIPAKPVENHRDYVLSRPNKNESDIFKNARPQIAQIVGEFIRGDFAETTYTTK